MSLNLLEQGLICLEVASLGMETNDTQKLTLVIGQIGHSLGILDMGVLKKHVHTQPNYVYTRHYTSNIIITSTY